MSEYVIIWAFRSRKNRHGQFEAMYGPKGKWAKLFRQSKAYLGTELLKSDDDPGLYLTIDRWKSEKAYEAFLDEKEASYAKLDDQCEKLTDGEEFLGRYVA